MASRHEAPVRKKQAEEVRKTQAEAAVSTSQGEAAIRTIQGEAAARPNQILLDKLQLGKATGMNIVDLVSAASSVEVEERQTQIGKSLTTLITLRSTSKENPSRSSKDNPSGSSSKDDPSRSSNKDDPSRSSSQADPSFAGQTQIGKSLAH